MTRAPPNTHEPRTRRAPLRKRLARARREDTEATGSPLPKHAAPSPLAVWLLDPTPEAGREALRLAALGRLTRADVMAAFVAELWLGTEALARPDGELCRRAQVGRIRLLDAIAKTLAPSTSSGPVMRTVLVWPSREFTDRGEDVRLEGAA